MLYKKTNWEFTASLAVSRKARKCQKKHFFFSFNFVFVYVWCIHLMYVVFQFGSRHQRSPSVGLLGCITYYHLTRSANLDRKWFTMLLLFVVFFFVWRNKFGSAFFIAKWEYHREVGRQCWWYECIMPSPLNKSTIRNP